MTDECVKLNQETHAGHLVFADTCETFCLAWAPYCHHLTSKSKAGNVALQPAIVGYPAPEPGSWRMSFHSHLRFQKIPLK